MPEEQNPAGNPPANGNVQTIPATDPQSGFPTAQVQPVPHPAESQQQNDDSNRNLPPRDPDTGRFTKEDIEKARKEEKDKLYGRIDEMAEQLKIFQQEREERLKAEEEAKRAAEEEAEAKRKEEMDLKGLLEETNKTWEQRFEQVQKEREAERAILAKEQEFLALQQYRRDAIEANVDDILPELHDLIQGNTQEEIDASVTSMKERTERILNQMSAAAGAQRMQMKGASITAPPVGPTENESAHQTLSQAEIDAMDMNTYMQNRERLLDAVRNQVQDRGLYG